MHILLCFIKDGNFSADPRFSAIESSFFRYYTSDIMGVCMQAIIFSSFLWDTDNLLVKSLLKNSLYIRGVVLYLSQCRPRPSSRTDDVVMKIIRMSGTFCFSTPTRESFFITRSELRAQEKNVKTWKKAENASS